MLEAALKYAALGFHVFPVSSNCRVPISVEGWFEHGVNDATCDPVEITRRWQRFPSANIAIACKASGVLALDIDRKGDIDGFAQLAELEAEFEPLPETWASETPSGGQHHLFKYPLGVDPLNRVGISRFYPDGSKKKYPGLDIRGKNASVAVAPSRKPNGAYRWIRPPSSMVIAPVPRWLLALLLSEAPPRPPADRIRFSGSDKAARYVSAAVDRECSNLACMGQGTGRNLALFQAAANLGELVGAGALSQQMAEHALEIAAHENRLVHEDGMQSVRASIRSGMTKGMAKPRELSF